MSTSACSQGGLNTVDIPAISLWQQMLLYLLPMITTPIFINSSLVFMRLNWFEKKIHGVNVLSKQQSKLRRNTTMAHEHPLDPTQNSNSDSSNEKNQTQVQQNNANLKSHKSNPWSLNLLIDEPFRRLPHKVAFNNLSPDTQRTHNSDTLDIHKKDTAAEANEAKPLDDRDIKFSDPPRPHHAHLENDKGHTLVRQNSIQPHELIRSIGMMEKSQNNSTVSLSPAYVVKGPRDSITEKTGMDSDSETGVGSRHDMPAMQRATTLAEKRSSSVESERPGITHRSYTIGRLGKALKPSDSFAEFLMDQNRPSKLKKRMSSNYVSFEPTIGGNSVFVDLTKEQREELGGIEYRALKILSKILVVYYIGFHLLGALFLMPWAIVNRDNVPNNPVWWGFFTAASSFNNLGITLTADSMNSFVNQPYPILVSSVLILIGNTAFPCFLRCIIWIYFKLAPENGRTKESLGFLLDHPRRCFTLLFPSNATWWLFGVLVVLNVVDVILFIILDINNPAVSNLSVGTRILAGLYQSLCTRTAGFTTISLSQLHVAVQVSYMVMMYVSVLPLAMSIRRTNVYEEQSLGIYADPTAQSPSMIVTHIRRQLSYDLWFIFLGLFIITIAEGSRLAPGDEQFNTFSVLFEVVSAYGTVGLSLGYSGTDTSFSGQFTTVSKLVIIALLYRGKHRGLPYSVDRAIILPSKKLDRKDTEQENKIKKMKEENDKQNIMV